MNKIKQILVSMAAITILIFSSVSVHAEDEWKYDEFKNPIFHHYINSYTDSNNNVFRSDIVEQWKYTYGGATGNLITNTVYTRQATFMKNGLLSGTSFMTETRNSSYRRTAYKSTSYAPDGRTIIFTSISSYYYSYIYKNGGSGFTHTFYNADGSKTLMTSIGRWGAGYSYSSGSVNKYDTRGNIISSTSFSNNHNGVDFYTTERFYTYTYTYSGNAVMTKSADWRISQKKNERLTYYGTGASFSDTNYYRTNTVSKFYNEDGLMTRMSVYNYEYNYSTHASTSKIINYDYAYYASGNLKSKTISVPDESGNIKYEYMDENFQGRGYGRISKITKADGMVEVFEYWYNTDVIKTKVGYYEGRYDSNGLRIVNYKYEYAEDGRLQVVTEPQSGRRITYKYDSAGKITGYTKEWGSFYSGIPNYYGDYTYVFEEYDANWNRRSAYGPMADLLVRDALRRFSAFQVNWFNPSYFTMPFILSISPDGMTVSLDWAFSLYYDIWQNSPGAIDYSRGINVKQGATYTIDIMRLPNNVHYPVRILRADYADGSHDEYIYEEGAAAYEDHLIRIDAYSSENTLMYQYFMDQNHNMEYMLIYYENGAVVKTDRNLNIIEVRTSGGAIERYTDGRLYSISLPNGMELDQLGGRFSTSYYPSGNLTSIITEGGPGSGSYSYYFLDEAFYGNTSIGNMGRMESKRHLRDGRFPDSAGVDLYMYVYWGQTDKLKEMSHYDSRSYYIGFRLIEKKEYDTNQNVVQTTRYEYHASGNIESKTYSVPDESGNIKYEYMDENFQGRGYGRISKITKADNSYELFIQYWGETEQVKIKELYDLNGNLTARYEYDSDGNLLSQSQAARAPDENLARISVNQMAYTEFADKNNYNIQGQLVTSNTPEIKQ